MNNNKMERFNGEFRDREKVVRGLKKKDSIMFDGYQIYHNYLRPHESLEGLTPAEASGINLNLGQDKIKDLIQQSTQEKNFVTQLGKRIEKVTIVNEHDCINVIPKEWIEKQTWREINDILRLNGFSWVSNDKDSCWLKPFQNDNSKSSTSNTSKMKL